MRFSTVTILSLRYVHPESPLEMNTICTFGTAGDSWYTLLVVHNRPLWNCIRNLNIVIFIYLNGAGPKDFSTAIQRSPNERFPLPTDWFKCLKWCKIVSSALCRYVLTLIHTNPIWYVRQLRNWLSYWRPSLPSGAWSGFYQQTQPRHCCSNDHVKHHLFNGMWLKNHFCVILTPKCQTHHHDFKLHNHTKFLHS